MKKSLGQKTLIYPSPVWCVGTYDKDGRPNVMTIAWGGICCSEPPCVNISLRKATYTYGNLMERKAFTLSVPPEKYVKEADYYGIESGRNENKFEKTGLTPVKSSVVDAPYVDEFPMILECELIHHHEIGLHTIFIGRILDVKAEEEMINSEGKVDIKKVAPFVFTPVMGGYYGIGEYIGKAFKTGKDLMNK